MTEPLNTAILVLVVGMITVFVILSLVVLSGNVLIRVVNRYYPEIPLIQSSKKGSPDTNQVAKTRLAAIVAAVDAVTQGRGKVTKIERKE